MSEKCVVLFVMKVIFTDFLMVNGQSVKNVNCNDFCCHKRKSENLTMPIEYDILNSPVKEADFLCQNAPLVCERERTVFLTGRRTRGFLLGCFMVDRICKVCGVHFEGRRPTFRKPTRGNYCSRKCLSICPEVGSKRSQKLSGNKNPRWKGKINKTCLICKNTFDVEVSHENRKYCSIKCASKARIGSHHQNWTLEARRCLSIARIGSKNPNWKGLDVGRLALHGWIRNRKIKPFLCERCKQSPPYDLANISGEYKRDIKDFEWLCRRCHMEKDGRLDKLIKGNKCRFLLPRKGIRGIALWLIVFMLSFPYICKADLAWNEAICKSCDNKVHIREACYHKLYGWLCNKCEAERGKKDEKDCDCNYGGVHSIFCPNE